MARGTVPQYGKRSKTASTPAGCEWRHEFKRMDLFALRLHQELRTCRYAAGARYTHDVADTLLLALWTFSTPGNRSLLRVGRHHRQETRAWNSKLIRSLSCNHRVLTLKKSRGPRRITALEEDHHPLIWESAPLLHRPGIYPLAQAFHFQWPHIRQCDAD